MKQINWMSSQKLVGGGYWWGGGGVGAGFSGAGGSVDQMEPFSAFTHHKEKGVSFVTWFALGPGFLDCLVICCAIWRRRFFKPKNR